MNILSYILNSTLVKGFRELKVLRLGGDDVQVISEVSPAGIDSAPHPDTVAVYAETVGKDAPLSLGYLNEGQQAKPGEIRIYATDENGTVLFYTWCKADGTYHMGGTADNAVRFAPLQAGIEKMATDINAELTKIQGLLSGIGLVYPRVPIVPDISGSKIDKIKTL